MLELLAVFVCLWLVTNIIAGLIGTIVDLFCPNSSKRAGRLGV